MRCRDDDADEDDGNPPPRPLTDAADLFRSCDCIGIGTVPPPDVPDEGTLMTVSIKCVVRPTKGDVGVVDDEDVGAVLGIVSCSLLMLLVLAVVSESVRTSESSDISEEVVAFPREALTAVGALEDDMPSLMPSRTSYHLTPAPAAGPTETLFTLLTLLVLFISVGADPSGGADGEDAVSPLAHRTTSARTPSASRNRPYARAMNIAASLLRLHKPAQ